MISDDLRKACNIDLNNEQTGSSRASSVASYLGALGVPSTQMTETSRGKLDATGADDAGWQLDRRVDID